MMAHKQRQCEHDITSVPHHLAILYSAGDPAGLASNTTLAAVAPAAPAAPASVPAPAPSPQAGIWTAAQPLGVAAALAAAAAVTLLWA